MYKVLTFHPLTLGPWVVSEDESGGSHLRLVPCGLCPWNKNYVAEFVMSLSSGEASGSWDRLGKRCIGRAGMRVVNGIAGRGRRSGMRGIGRAELGYHNCNIAPRVLVA